MANAQHVTIMPIPPPLQHATINNLGFGRSVDETKRVLQVWVLSEYPSLVQAF